MAFMCNGTMHYITQHMQILNSYSVHVHRRSYIILWLVSCMYVAQWVAMHGRPTYFISLVSLTMALSLKKAVNFCKRRTMEKIHNLTHTLRSYKEFVGEVGGKRGREK